jgi:hypothetical protein
MRLITFTTEKSTEESKKSMDESKNGWSNNGRSKKQRNKNTELQIWSSLSSGRKETTRIYRGGPLVSVGGSNQD